MTDDFDHEFVNDFGQTFAQGIRMMAEDEFEEAVRLFSEVIEVEPIFAEAYAFRGSAKYFLGRMAEAKEDCEAALDLNANCLEALTLQGRMAIDARKYLTAQTVLAQALELDSENMYAHSLMGRLYLDIGSYAEAVAEFNAMLQQDPDDRFALISRAWGLSYLGLFEEAFLDNDRLLEFDSDDSDVLFQRAILCFTMKRYEEVLAHTDKALKNPGRLSLRLYNYKSWSLLYLNRFEESLELFEKSVDDTDKATVRTMYGHAVALGRLGRLDECKAKLLEMLNLAHQLNLGEYDRLVSGTLDHFNAETAAKLPLLNDNFARMMNIKAVKKIDEDLYDEALQMLNEAIEADPLFEWSYDNRAKIHYIREEYEKVLENIEIMLQLSDDLDNRYKKALALSRLHRFDEAFDMFTDLLKENVDASILYERARIYRIRGEMEKAIEDLTRAIDIGDEDDIERSLQTRAYYYGTLGQFDKALDDYARILYFQPDHIGVLHNRATLYYHELDRYEEAVRDEIRVLKMNPELQEAYMIRGASWGRLALEIENARTLTDEESTETKPISQLFPRPVAWPEIAEQLQSKEFYDSEECWQHAFEDLEKSLEKNSDDGDTHWELGYFHYKNDNSEKAREEFQLVLKKTPENSSALYWYARISCEQGLNEDAIQAADAALERAPDAEGFHYIKAQALRQMFRFKEAQKEYEIFLEKNPDHYFTVVSLADIKKILGSYDEAIALTDLVLNKYGYSPYAFFTKVEILICSDRLDEAVELLLHSTQETPNQARANATLGEVYATLEMEPLAKEYYEKAIQSTPSDWDPDSIHTLYRGIALAALGNHEAAIPCFVDSLSEQERLAPCNESDYWLARSYFALGRYEESQKHVHRAMQYLSLNRGWTSRIQACQRLLNDLERIFEQQPRT